MKKIIELKKHLRVLSGNLKRTRGKISKTESKIHKIEIEPKIKKLIGKCFKYRNSYGQGEDWWMYIKVVDYKPISQCVIVCTYQKTTSQEHQIQMKKEQWGVDLLDDHLLQMPITKKQFNSHINKAIKDLEKMKAL